MAIRDYWDVDTITALAVVGADPEKAGDRVTVEDKFRKRCLTLAPSRLACGRGTSALAACRTFGT